MTKKDIFRKKNLKSLERGFDEKDTFHIPPQIPTANNLSYQTRNSPKISHQIEWEPRSTEREKMAAQTKYHGYNVQQESEENKTAASTEESVPIFKVHKSTRKKDPNRLDLATKLSPGSNNPHESVSPHNASNRRKSPHSINEVKNNLNSSTPASNHHLAEVSPRSLRTSRSKYSNDRQITDMEVSPLTTNGSRYAANSAMRVESTPRSNINTYVSERENVHINRPSKRTPRSNDGYIKKEHIFNSEYQNKQVIQSKIPSTQSTENKNNGREIMFLADRIASPKLELQKASGIDIQKKITHSPNNIYKTPRQDAENVMGVDISSRIIKDNDASFPAQQGSFPHVRSFD